MIRDMWIEHGKVDKNKLFDTVKFSGDAVSFQQCIEAIVNRINEAEDSKEEALKKLKEWNKDEELQKLRNELEKVKNDSYRGFSISEDEEIEINNWIDNHLEEKHGLITLKDRILSQGAIGGRFTYEFIPTSIGTIGTIKCTCGDKFTFRDLS